MALPRGRMRRLVDRCWPSAKTQYHGSVHGTDTVVFVHGIFTHGVHSWGEFPRLIKADPDLPRLDCLLYCYPTGCIARHHSLAQEGLLLVNEVQGRVSEEHQAFLVGHSMGGLIILKGLVDRMTNGHANDSPCCSVSGITLFASPLKGAWAANVVRLVVGPLLQLVMMLKKHVKDLSRGEFVDLLMPQVVNRIYKPAASDSGNRRIPIRLVLPIRDETIGKANLEEAFAMFKDPVPVSLNEDHGSVKMPLEHADLRYMALTRDLQKQLTPKFRQLCREVIDQSVTETEREFARSEMMERYGFLIRHRVGNISSPDKYSETEENFLSLLAMYGAKNNVPPSYAANQVLKLLDRRRARR
jgi:pimeloyl-ACP methyl ester carboxylesterase